MCVKIKVFPGEGSRARMLLVVAVTVMPWIPEVVLAQVAFNEPPIAYEDGPLGDPVALLQQRLDDGEANLAYDERNGYLRAVLEHLGVPQSSQTLVFSKTSLQRRYISPRTPRALYFGDDVYVGWVQGGEVLEFSSVDPSQGAVFYTLEQKRAARPAFVRQVHECLQCHGSALSDGVPGHVVRSVYPEADGRPLLSAGTYLTDHSSPLEQRWGGWYVTGSHGRQRHLGNLVLERGQGRDDMDTDVGANLENLGQRFETSAYLTPHSDIVALMVLEHQARMHNLITRANYTARRALHDDTVLNEVMERPASYRSESATRRIRSVAEPLLHYLLLCRETRLTDPIVGTSDFAKEFSARGPRDRRGRSLYELDLRTRLFKYPLSYLIYSDAFEALPKVVLEYVYRRLWKILNGWDPSDDFDHLSAADRAAVLDILRETKRGIPDSWKKAGLTSKRRLRM